MGNSVLAVYLACSGWSWAADDSLRLVRIQGVNGLDKGHGAQLLTVSHGEVTGSTSAFSAQFWAEASDLGLDSR